MELVQCGAYDRPEHVRAFLLKVFGRGSEGPVANRLGNHMQLQPVIDIAPDDNSAKIRIRMFQQMSFGPRALVGAAVYENTAVLERGTACPNDFMQFTRLLHHSHTMPTPRSQTMN
jgi:hypothetical protein